MSVITIALVDDHRVVTRSLKAYLESFSDLTVVGIASSGEELLEHIRQAATGQLTLSPQLTQILAQALRGDEHPQRIEELTDRERQILRQLAQGYSNKMIARKLDITEGTVKVHVKRVLHKLGMRSRVEAAVWAVENHLA